MINIKNLTSYLYSVTLEITYSSLEEDVENTLHDVEYNNNKLTK